MNMYTSTPIRKPSKSISRVGMDQKSGKRNLRKPKDNSEVLDTHLSRQMEKMHTGEADTPLRTPVQDPRRRSMMNRTENNKATPFQTPRLTSQIRELKVSGSEAQGSKDSLVELNGLLNKSWKFCYASSMCNFDYTKKNIRSSYESMLKAKILQTFPAKSLVVALTETKLPGFDSSQATDVVRLTVTCRKQKKVASGYEEVVVCVYEAWLFATNQPQMTASEAFKWFPLILFNGPAIINKAVTGWLQASFGCYITRPGFPQRTMMWIAALWSKYQCNNPKHKNNQKLVMTYKIQPPSTENFKQFQGENMTVKMTYEASDMNDVWKLVEKVEDIRKEDESLEPSAVQRFHSSMEDFVFSQLHIPTSMMHLSKLKTSCIDMAINGVIQLNCSKTFSSFLGHLTEILVQTSLSRNMQNVTQ